MTQNSPKSGSDGGPTVLSVNSPTPDLAWPGLPFPDDGRTRLYLPPPDPQAPLQSASIEAVRTALHERGYILRDQQTNAGSLGSVYIADCAYSSKTSIAVKIPIVRHEDRGSSFHRVGRVLREGRILAAVQHPALLGIRDLIFVEDVPILLLNYISGESADSHFGMVRRESQAPNFHGDRLLVSKFLSVMEDICHAAHALHSEKIVHRDVKPSNIMVVPCDAGVRGKLIDLGLAKEFADTSENHLGSDDRVFFRNGGVETSFSRHLGTPRYMAPEQHAHISLDGRADIYAAGVILYRFFCGRFPISDHAARLGAIFDVCEPPVPRPCTLNSTIPTALESVIMTCLERSPARRMLSADRLARELNDINASLVA